MNFGGLLCSISLRISQWRLSILKIGINNTPGETIGNLFVDYLRNNPIQFFEWDMEKRDFLRNITFKTKERSIFKNYQENLASLYWSSL